MVKLTWKKYKGFTHAIVFSSGNNSTVDLSYLHPTDHQWSLHELQEGVEAEGRQGFPHAGLWAAFGGHRCPEPTVSSTVEEPHLRRVRRLVNTERQDREGKRDSKHNFSSKKYPDLSF